MPASQNSLATAPVPFAVALGSTHAPPAAPQVELATLPEYLTLPTWMSQALDSPQVAVRLQALDAWAKQGPQASLDPLIVGLDDEDDDVRDKAMAIIEWHWEAGQEGEHQTAK